MTFQETRVSRLARFAGDECAKLLFFELEPVLRAPPRHLSTSRPRKQSDIISSALSKPPNLFSDSAATVESTDSKAKLGGGIASQHRV